MKITARLLFLLGVLSFLPIAAANAIDDFLNTLGLETFSVITTDSISPLDLTSVCTSSVVTGSNDLGSYQATGYVQYVSTTNNLLTQTYNYEVYWYFTYDSPIQATDFGIYGGSSYFSTATVWADLYQGTFLLQYAEGRNSLITACASYNFDTWSFFFNAPTSVLTTRNYLIVLGGGLLNVQYANAIAACAVLKLALPNTIQTCDVIKNNLCLVNDAGSCTGTYEQPYPSTSVISTISGCTVEQVDLYIPTTTAVLTSSPTFTVSYTTVYSTLVLLGVTIYSTPTATWASTSSYVTSYSTYVPTTVISVSTTQTVCPLTPPSSIPEASSSEPASSSSLSSIISSSVATSETVSSIPSSNTPSAGTTSSTEATSESSSTSTAEGTSTEAVISSTSPAESSSSSSAAASAETSTGATSSIVSTEPTTAVSSESPVGSVSFSTTVIFTTTFLNDCEAYSSMNGL